MASWDEIISHHKRKIKGEGGSFRTGNNHRNQFTMWVPKEITREDYC